MQRKKSRSGRDPYFYLKLFNIAAACVITVLAVLRIVLEESPDFIVRIAFVLGIIMCVLTGIMELAKNDKLIGYACSILAGILAVALIFTLVAGLGA